MSRIAIIVALLSALCLGCGDLHVISGPPAEEAEIPIRITGMEMRTFVGDSLDQVVTAASAEMYQDARQTRLEDFTLSFYEEGSEIPISSIQGDYAVTDHNTGQFEAEARDDRIVVTRSDDRITLLATTFKFDAERDELGTDQPFVLLQLQPGGGAQVFRGVGITTDRRMEVIQFRHPQVERLPSVDVDEFIRQERPLHTETSSS